MYFHAGSFSGSAVNSSPERKNPPTLTQKEDNLPTKSPTQTPEDMFSSQLTFDPLVFIHQGYPPLNITFQIEEKICHEQTAQ